MLKCFHDFNFIVGFNTVLFFIDLNKFRCQQMLRRDLAAFLHFAEFASRNNSIRLNSRRSPVHRFTCREIPSIRIRLSLICSSSL